MVEKDKYVSKVRTLSTGRFQNIKVKISEIEILTDCSLVDRSRDLSPLFSETITIGSHFATPTLQSSCPQALPRQQLLMLRDYVEGKKTSQSFSTLLYSRSENEQFHIIDLFSYVWTLSFRRMIAASSITDIRYISHSIELIFTSLVWIN